LAVVWGKTDSASKGSGTDFNVFVIEYDLYRGHLQVSSRLDFGQVFAYYSGILLRTVPGILFKYSINILFIQPYQTEAKRSSQAVPKNYDWSVVRLFQNLSFSYSHQITCVFSRNAL